jgi:plasmid maintenance system antidote protein VapI
MTKPIERGIARQLRAECGEPIKKLAAALGVSPGTVSRWVRDIELTPEQHMRNQRRAGTKRGEAWRELHRSRRRAYQEEGRRQARAGDPLHLAGCMLYWAEGSKGRNAINLTNSDPRMLRFFARFLRTSMDVESADLSIRLNVYLGNGLSLEQIERHWLEVLDLSRGALRKHSIDHFPTSSSGRRRTLPYGVCTLRVRRSTRLVQRIYGAIQEYAGFDEPRWLDGAHQR